MAFSPEVFTYDNLRREAEEFLGEHHKSLSIPTPIEEIVEFDLSIDVIPILGLRDEIKVDAFLASDLTAIYMDEYILEFVPARFERLVGEAEAGGIRRSRLFEHPQRQHLIEKLASDFQVSEKTMGIRLEKDALIPALGTDI